MPSYEYVCDSCGYTFDVSRRMSDDPVAQTCPQCGNSARQVFSTGFGLSFSGKGFYTTDTRKKESGTSAAAGTGTTPAHSCGSSCGCSCATGANDKKA